MPAIKSADPPATTSDAFLAFDIETVCSGGVDGHPPAYSKFDGKIIWAVDTQACQPVNGAK